MFFDAIITVVIIFLITRGVSELLEVIEGDSSILRAFFGLPSISSPLAGFCFHLRFDACELVIE